MFPVLRVCAALGAGLLASASVLEAQPADPLTVSINATFDGSVSSGVTKAIARQEATDIWSAYGVELHWDAATDNAFHLDVIVASDRTIEMRPGALSVLGKTVLDGEGVLRGPIRINFEAINELCEHRLSNSMLLRERELGRALGRVLAHEIGHALLGVPAYHETEGLMRVTIPLDDLVLPERRNLGLMDDSVVRLRARVPCFNETGTGACSTRLTVDRGKE